MSPMVGPGITGSPPLTSNPCTKRHCHLQAFIFAASTVASSVREVMVSGPESIIAGSLTGVMDVLRVSIIISFKALMNPA